MCVCVYVGCVRDPDSDPTRSGTICCYLVSSSSQMGAVYLLYLVPRIVPSRHKLSTERNVSAPKRWLARKPEEASKEKNPAAAGIFDMLSSS